MVKTQLLKASLNQKKCFRICIFGKTNPSTLSLEELILDKRKKKLPLNFIHPIIYFHMPSFVSWQFWSRLKKLLPIAVSLPIGFWIFWNFPKFEIRLGLL
jgi:hypothetical protein